MQTTLTEPSRQTPVLGEYEVVVLGGGPAGIAAAVAAARAGRSTAHLARDAGCNAADVDIAALQTRLERDGAYLGRSW